MECKQFHGKGSVENVVLDEKDWKKSWEIGDIGFHEKDINEDLIKYERQLLSEKKRIFVPLCGKSVDLNYLADKGHDVVGCEFSKMAILEFFDEHSIKFERSQHNTAPYEIFKGIDKNITIYKGDFFGLTSSLMGKFDAVWDRGSFVAIHPSQRNNYVSVISELMNPGAAYLLTGVEHASTDGPPFSISMDAVTHSFGHCYNCTLLDSCEVRDVGFFEELGLQSGVKVTFELLLK